ncbi:MAG: ribosomal-processing cysteine protease Prp [bacterium]|nr:ribosomal-processing cysteine protease Prp [bacterium]
MIKVNCVVSNELIESVTIKGHADYASYGKDIVCAAVSSIVTTTVNDILTLDDKAINYGTNDGSVEITVIQDNVIANKLLNTMLNMLKELAYNYPKNIKIGGLK